MTHPSTPQAVITGVAETPYLRRATNITTGGVLADAATAAVKDAGLAWSDIDGLAVSSFSLNPDHAIDLAWRLGLKVTWVADFFTGGANNDHGFGGISLANDLSAGPYSIKSLYTSPFRV